MHLSEALLKYINAYSRFDPSQFTPLHINGQTVGRIHHELAKKQDFLDSFQGRLTQDEKGFHLIGFETTKERTRFLNDFVVPKWVELGLVNRKFNEDRSAIVEPGGDPLLQLDRAASHFLGVDAPGVFLVAYERDLKHLGEITIWVAKRSQQVKRAPGMLHVFAGGGIASGDFVWDTLCREAEEEARLPRELIELAQPAGKCSTMATKDKIGSQAEPTWVYTLDFTDDATRPANLRKQIREFKEYLLRLIPGKDFSEEVECFQRMSVKEIKGAFETKEFKDNIAPAYAVALISLGIISPSDPYYQPLNGRLNIQPIDKAGRVIHAAPLPERTGALSGNNRNPAIPLPSAKSGQS